jgi:hypothetical protein
MIGSLGGEIAARERRPSLRERRAEYLSGAQGERRAGTGTKGAALGAQGEKTELELSARHGSDGRALGRCQGRDHGRACKGSGAMEGQASGRSRGAAAWAREELDRERAEEERGDTLGRSREERVGEGGAAGRGWKKLGV